MGTNGKPDFSKVGLITRKELEEAIFAVGKIVGQDVRQCINQVNAVTKGFNDLRIELGTAQNTTAEIVDSLMLHLRFTLEKLGGFDADGNPTPEFTDWCAAKIAKVEELKAKAIAEGTFKEPVPASN